MKKSYLAVLVVFVIALGVGVFVWQKQESWSQGQPKQNKIAKMYTLADIDTSDWRTYKNTAYGYSFRYPNILNVFALAYGGGYADEKSRDIFVSLSNQDESYEDQMLDLKWVFSVEIFDTDELLDSFAEQKVDKYVSKESISIGGLESIRYVSADENQDWTFIRHANHIFLIRQTTQERNIGKTQELQRSIVESFSWM